MAAQENYAGNTYIKPDAGVGVGAGDVHQNNPNETTEQRTLRLKCTSEQGRYLSYLTMKHMVRTQGPHVHRGASLGMNTWNAIARQLNALGIEKTPEQWRKCYSAAKYFAHMRFTRMMREKQAVTGNPNVRPDWKDIEIRDLLYLQDWRSKGFPDMPEPDLLIAAFEDKKLYLHEYNAPKQSFDYQRDMFYDNTTFGNPFGDFAPFSLHTPHQPQHDELQIKCELESSIDVDASEDFKQQLEQMVETHSRKDYGPNRSNSHQLAAMMQMPKPMPMPHMEHEAHVAAATSTTTTTSAGGTANNNNNNKSGGIFMKAQPSNCLELIDSGPNTPASAAATVATLDNNNNTNASPSELYYLERRLLEVSEKLLKEKSKQNKILRRKNKILKQTRKDQKKQTEVLNRLLEQLVRRT